MIETGDIYLCEACGHRWLPGGKVPARCAKCKASGWNARGKVDAVLPERAQLVAANEALVAEVAMLKRELAKRPADLSGLIGVKVPDVQTMTTTGNLGDSIEELEAGRRPTLDAIGPLVTGGRGKASIQARSRGGSPAVKPGYFCEHGPKHLCRFGSCRAR